MTDSDLCATNVRSRDDIPVQFRMYHMGMHPNNVPEVDMTLIGNLDKIPWPNINGIPQAGIGATADQALAKDHKLVVVPDVFSVPALAQNDVAAINAFATYSAIATVLRVSNSANLTSLILREQFYFNAALVCKLGFISYLDERCFIPSSDFHTENGFTQVSTAVQDKLWSYITIERQQEILTLITATKVNYFNANHHTGQGTPSNYIRKVIAACPLWTQVFPSDLAPGAVHPLHQIGHGASTKDLFRAMGIPDVLPTHRPLKWPNVEFRISEDLRIRLRSMPAGCAKLGLIVAGARVLVHSDLARFVPRLEEISPLKEDYDRLLQHPLLYHIGAKYLTGSDQDTGPNAAHLWFGRIGTFIYYVMRGTTLASSQLSPKVTHAHLFCLFGAARTFPQLSKTYAKHI